MSVAYGEVRDERRFHGHLLGFFVPVLLFLGILVFSAATRFDSITKLGISTGDAFDYVREAKLWADGDPL